VFDIAKLYFRYGTMGSSKSANALMTRFNYIERGYRVLLMKPAVDVREGRNVVHSRIGLEALAELLAAGDTVRQHYGEMPPQCIILDEAQFATEEQVEELRDIADLEDIPVFCYGLRTDFRTRLFPGSRRLFELADSVYELKCVCDCGRKAIVNARYANGRIVSEGAQIAIGGNEMYRGLCYRCWKRERGGD
jgi:Thymidine kinase